VHTRAGCIFKRMAHHRRSQSSLHHLQPVTVHCLCVQCAASADSAASIVGCFCMHCMPHVWSFSVPCCMHITPHIVLRLTSLSARARQCSALRGWISALHCWLLPVLLLAPVHRDSCFQCDATGHTCAKGKNGERCNTPGNRRPTAASCPGCVCHPGRSRGMYVT
jgi:hypothetical protein